MAEQRFSIGRRGLLAAASGGLAFMSAGLARAQAIASAAMAPPLPPAWTGAEALPLWKGEPPGGGFKAAPPSFRMPPSMISGVARPELKVFRPARSNGRALLVIPGGGYMIISVINEGLEIAQRMTAVGYTVYVLLYRLPGEGWLQRSDAPLQDAQRAMRLIRSRGAGDGFDPAKVAVVGFSAGGHLAASLTTGFAEPVYAPRDAADRLDARPAAAGLVYPVITLEAPYAHAGSARALLGAAPDAALVARRSPQLHVGEATPPVFLVHAVDDPAVPMQNSEMMLDAMKAAHRPVEAHFFPTGGHGFGLGRAGSRCAEWSALFIDWLDKNLAG